MATVVQLPETLIRRKQVQARTGLSRSGMYQMIAEGAFPGSIKIGARSVGWVQSEIDEWVASRIETSRQNRGGL